MIFMFCVPNFTCKIKHLSVVPVSVGFDCEGCCELLFVSCNSSNLLEGFTDVLLQVKKI